MLTMDHAMKAAYLAITLTILFFASLSAADDGGDITPPVLVAAAADRYQIDTSNGAQTVTFTLHITDDLSGVKGVHIELRHKNGYNAARTCQRWSAQAVIDATILCAIRWPRYSAEGTWLVTWMVLTDGVDNAGDGNVATCVTFVDGKCSEYAYSDLASAAIRSMQINIGTAARGADPSLYLPLLTK